MKTSRIAAAATVLLLLATAVGAAPKAGSPDRSFSGDGKVVANFNSSSFDRTVGMAVRPDGKIVVLASTGVGTDSFASLFRLNPNGARDRSFGKKGRKRIKTPPGFAAFIEGLALDGNKIVLAAGNGLNFYAIRLKADGSRDQSFGAGGYTGMYVDDANVHDAVVTFGHRVVIAGYNFNTREDWAFVRFGADGVMDPSFSGDGKAFIDFSSDGMGDDRLAAAIGDGKKIFGVGQADPMSQLAFARLTAGGALDPTFSGDGRLTLPKPTEFARLRGVTRAPNGYVAVGGTGESAGDYMLVRIRRNGQPAPGFGTNGVRLLDRGAAESYEAVTVQPDGKIVAVGQSCTGEICKLAIGRHRANGTFDPSFGKNGLVLLRFATGHSLDADAVAWQTDGRILAAGTTSIGIGQGSTSSSAAAQEQRIAIARVNSAECGILGNARSNRLRGTPARDYMCGAGGNDVLIGGPGNDVLVGGRGRDRCVGGPGKDTLKGCER